MTNIQKSEMDKNHFEYIIWAAVSVRNCGLWQIQYHNQRRTAMWKCR